MPHLLTAYIVENDSTDSTAQKTEGFMTASTAAFVVIVLRYSRHLWENV